MRSWRRELPLPALILGVVLVVAIVAQIVVGLTQRSWTDAYAYGEVGVPGRSTLHLPAGSLDITLRELTAATVQVPPGLHLSVVPLEGAAVPLTRDVGGDFGPNSRTSTVAYRRVFSASIPREGAYRVSAAGVSGDRGYSVEFGHAPATIAGKVWAYAGIAALAGLLAWLIGRITGLSGAPGASRR